MDICNFQSSAIKNSGKLIFSQSYDLATSNDQLKKEVLSKCMHQNCFFKDIKLGT